MPNVEIVGEREHHDHTAIFDLAMAVAPKLSGARVGEDLWVEAVGAAVLSGFGDLVERAVDAVEVEERDVELEGEVTVIGELRSESWVLRLDS